jgi:hypothetical protein
VRNAATDSAEVNLPEAKTPTLVRVN